MQNDNTNATIQLDKLIFSCTSTVSDNFDEAVRYQPEIAFEPKLTFNKTTLSQTLDVSHRYKYSYTVNYDGNQMGQIDFCQHGFSWKDRIKFTVANPVFYNDTQCYLSNVLNDLNLKIENYTQIDTAIDSYNFNHEQILRRALRDKDNQVKLNGFIVRDRTKTLDEIIYFTKGSLNNPFKVRTILIKDKKETKEICAYDKKEEINVSEKGYILDYHKQINPKSKNLYRVEVKMNYKAISYYENEVIKKLITLDDLLNKEFLYSMFTNHQDRIILIRDKKKKEIPLHPNPIL
jgi:hypothetical protein